MQQLVTPLTHIHTPFREKFGTPRQPRLVEEALGVMEFPKNDFFLEAFRGIGEFSHLWLIFAFHQAVEEGVKALIRPPRFQGQEKWGVFATRSPHRPNHLGLSAVKFKQLEILGDKIRLVVSGVDLVDGTPILDIKPYVGYTDAIPEACSGPFQNAPEFKSVRWMVRVDLPQDLKQLLEKVIACDPRPAFAQEEMFGVSIAGYNVRFRCLDNEFIIEACTKE